MLNSQRPREVEVSTRYKGILGSAPRIDPRDDRASLIARMPSTRTPSARPAAFLSLAVSCFRHFSLSSCPSFARLLLLRMSFVDVRSIVGVTANTKVTGRERRG